MTSFTVSSLSTTLQSLSASEFGFVTETGTLNATGVAVSMFNQSTLQNFGTIASPISAAVTVQGTNIVIMNSGTITASTVFSVVNYIGLSGPDTHIALTNDGEIIGSLRLTGGVNLCGGDLSIVNTGTIAGNADDGIRVFAPTFQVSGGTITNSGLVLGATGMNLESNSGILTVTNSGTIQTTENTAIQCSGIGVFSIKNTGTILGSVILSSGADSVTGDGGVISGNLLTGFGADLIALTSTSIGGTIQADEGENAIRLTGCEVSGDILSGDDDTTMRLIDTVVNGTVHSGAGFDEVQVTGGAISLDVDISGGGGRVALHGVLVGGSVIGGDGNDAIDVTGSTIAGSLQGGTGSDLYTIDDSNLLIQEDAGSGNDSVVSSASYDLGLADGSEIENLALVGEALRGTGNQFANVITGNAMDNVLSALGGNDTMDGGIGNDLLKGGADADNLSGSADDDVLKGGAGIDTLAGNTDDDLLNGGDDGDSLAGGDGNDTLIGGSGRDTMNGGNGPDLFIFKSAAEIGLVAPATNDFVNGFVSGQDVIDLSGIDAIAATSKNDEFTFIGAGGFTGVAGQLHVVVAGANLLVEGDVNGDAVADFQLRLNGIASLAGGDIVL